MGHDQNKVSTPASSQGQASNPGNAPTSGPYHAESNVTDIFPYLTAKILVIAQRKNCSYENVRACPVT
jgi:hypothetical protein